MTGASADAKTWTVGEVVSWATNDFRSRGIESPRLDAELLVSHALHIDRIKVITDAARPIEPTDLTRLRELIRRRRAREPMAYLLGTREFYGRVFKVDARVLVPRPETETLVDAALTSTAHVSMSMRALDLCTGSGCVAITLERERPTSSVMATDQSADALAVARDNALRLGATRVAFACGDLFEAVPTGCRFDVIVSNPPYVPTAEVAQLMPDVRDFEPHLALDGGADGLSFVRRIAEEARAHLVPGGVLAVEVALGQSEAASELFRSFGYRNVRSARDMARRERVVVGTLNA